MHNILIRGDISLKQLLNVLRINFALTESWYMTINLDYFILGIDKYPSIFVFYLIYFENSFE